MEKLYSIIIDFKGGTYLSQYEANSISNLKEKWINEELPKLSKIANFNAYQVKTIKRKFIEEKEIEFDGLFNAWNNDLGYISKDYFSVIIINTSKL
ncbi:hypothetical protein AAH994_15150 [Weeksellaceae bacterium A-14]